MRDGQGGVEGMVEASNSVDICTQKPDIKIVKNSQVSGNDLVYSTRTQIWKGGASGNQDTHARMAGDKKRSSLVIRY